MLGGIVEVVKGLVRREAARLVAWSGTAATAAVLFIAAQLGVELSAEFMAAVGVFAAAVMTELIRQFVYSRKTVEKIVEEVKEDAQETP
jgi:hypothetical protein